ncbi:gfo/Idh/MocA family oxidoreductase [candidate division KSB3 bacterium]|uniref:Gfo/Idh/MocA family oxidoreductase n=1 Tax=candidate division KSB3 bacterium TaxID=2044937 RepID=A0A9D5JVL7_9BACT|nr:gfo/Idh/MocA family oxidoreductase [candidate division KSB3 bacterium]MBD3324964.1 gfo/Idh/MocA family oxidoreductase [candidate division KSB3 bacterium]
MIRIAVIGFGYWGPNLVRNFSSFDACQVKTVVDTSESRLALAKKRYPALETTQSVEAVLRDPAIDAVAIALPVSLHYPVAKMALEHGKHVLLEKPMTATSQQALALIDLAEHHRKVLMVDHTFLYTGAVQKMQSLIAQGELGDIQYFDSVRINLGLFQHDINVIWDLAAHDLSILHYLVPDSASSVIATGISHTPNQIENIAYLTLYYPSNLIAHFSLSWTSPVKIRKILIGGTKKMLVYDDLEPTEKVKVYDTGYTMNSYEERNQLLVDYRIGDVHIPKVQMTEALQGVAEDFLQAMLEGTEPVSNFRTGLAVVKMLEAADASIKQRGREVQIA